MRSDIELEGVGAALRVRDEQEDNRVDTNVFLRGLSMMIKKEREEGDFLEAVEREPLISDLWGNSHHHT